MGKVSIGDKFGKLTVIADGGRNDKGRKLWICECSCIDKNIIKIREYCLTGGTVKSCGCLLSTKYHQNFKMVVKGNPDGKRIIRIWMNMMNRCNDPKNTDYHMYGGRGIKVCKEWYHFKKFYIWLTESSNYEIGKKLTLERINVNGDYCPENCTWIPFSEQGYNKQDTIRMPDGTPLIVYCRENNLNYAVIYTRIRKGIPIQKAISEPIKMSVIKMDNDVRLSTYCQENNLNFNTIKGRMRRGLSIEEAISTPIVNRPTIKAPDGSSIRKYCNKYKIPYDKFKHYRTKFRKDIPIKVIFKSYFEKHPELVYNLPEEELLRLFGEEIQAMIEMLGINLHLNIPS